VKMVPTSALFFASYLLIVSIASAEVIDLDSKNFEHLTQAATGATTGDWLIKFYAPWCGHCKKLEPVYEEVADILAGEINVARVDVPANRDLGTRFEIKGFPSMKFLSKGKVYDYNGKRKADAIVDFVRGGYEIHQPEDVPPAMGLFGEIMYVFRHAYKKASSDLRSGNYFTIDIFLTFMPFLFGGLILLILLVPVPEHPDYVAAKKRREAAALRSREEAPRPSEAAPPTSEHDGPTARTKND